APVIVPIDGGDPRPIPGTGPPDVPLEWSADGRQIYVFRRQQIPAKIFLLDLATGERRPWKEIRPSDPLATGIPKLLITPDGAAYAYRAIHITSELYIIDGLR
ncbi:MAG TPA: hypothetical protein VKH43_09915, partial [Thermoanaerobaculia bacterium]|nr:hypothetical protein [Thermoanaerobaculia bacterium]